MAAHTSRSDPASESVSSAVLDGDGPIGDSIGVADTQYITTTGTTPGATPFTTEATFTEAEARVAELTAAAEQVALASTRVTDLLTGTSVGAAGPATVLVRRLGLSTETRRLPGVMLHPGVRAASGLVPSAATTMADRRGPIRHAEARATVAEQRVAAEAEDLAVVVVAADLTAAGAGNRSFVVFYADREIQKWREAICGERS